MKGILIIILITINVASWGQNDIQYQNKALLKVLEKADIPGFSNIEELPIADSIQTKYRLQGKFFQIKSNVGKYKYIYTGRVNSCRAGGCSISVDIPIEGESEYFDYFILFDKNKTVQLVKVFNYQATHGHEVTAKGWLKQFIGHDGSEQLQVNKNIDAISGATITVYALTLELEMKTEILRRMISLELVHAKR